MLVAASLAILAFVPRAETAGRYSTADEPLWMRRTQQFGDAILRRDFAAASATTGQQATMPGVTTMWIGNATRALSWVAVRYGLAAPSQQPFAVSPQALHGAQLGVAVTTSALVGVIAFLAWQWAGPVAAITAGALLASEPFLVAHGAAFHTDALTGLFGAAGVLAMLLAFGIPEPRVDRRRGLAAAGGALLGCALLTKLSALPLLLGVAALLAGVLFHGARRVHGRPLGAEPRVAVRLLATAALGFVAALLTWPAIWADPVHQIRFLLDTAELALTPHQTFFLGHITGTPGPLFYAVALPLRMTPWFLLGVLALLPLALMRDKRWHVLSLIAIAAVPVAVLSCAAKQMDRYAVVVLPLVALAVGLGADVAVRSARARLGARWRWLPAAGALAVALAVAHAVWVAPWGLAYFNPLLGGSRVAERAVIIGWGEGLEIAGEQIRRREAPRCDVKIALKYHAIRSAFPCGTTIPDLKAADYVVLYISQRQRLPEQDVADIRRRGHLVGTVSIRDINYAEVYDMRPGSNAALDGFGG
ncbi:MAG: hypothetical protein AB7P78_11960 [Candidatus Binatia bacterium]